MGEPEDSNKIKLEQEHKIMSAFIDTAKTYVQLSVGALVLSITFVEKIIGDDLKNSHHYLLLCAWFFWLIAILAGALYQYLAARYLEDFGESLNLLRPRKHSSALSNLARHPYKVYGIFLSSFYVGTIFFAVFGAIKIIS